MNDHGSAGAQGATLRDYYELTKPRITYLVLLSVFAGMWLAHGGSPSPSLVFFTLVGAALSASSSSVLNNYIDRDIDGLMSRTAKRALPTGKIAPDRALIFGVALSLAGSGLLAAYVNWLASAIALGIVLFYVLIYTLWLKRRTSLCTEIGGIAGAAPPLIGWAAVTGGIDAPVVALFVLMLLWQPPHFWTLAIAKADDYRKANVPMLPVSEGERATKLRILLYTIAILPAASALYFMDAAGWVYLAITSFFGLLYLIGTVAFVVRPISAKSAKNLFLYSILYLTMVFVALFIDGGVVAA